MDSPNTSIRSEVSSDGHDWRILLSVMQDVGNMMNVTEDLNEINIAKDAVLSKDEERGAIVDKLAEELQILKAEHQEAQAAARRPNGTLSAAEHEAHVRELEQRQYAVGKALNEEQAAVAKKEVELGRIKAEREEVRRWDPTVGSEQNSQVLRLKMFRDMGFELRDRKPAKFLVRSDERGDVNVVTVDAAHAVQSANRLWALAS